MPEPSPSSFARRPAGDRHTTKAGRTDDHARSAEPIDADLAAAGACLLVVVAGVAAVAVGRGRARRSPVREEDVGPNPAGEREARRRSPASGVAASVDRARAFEADAVAVLEERYARGDLDEGEFEARLELVVGMADENTRTVKRARNR